MKRYLKTPEEVVQALQEGKVVYINKDDNQFKLINGIVSGFNGKLTINPEIPFEPNHTYTYDVGPLKLEVGKFYRTRDGRKAWVVSRQQGAYYAYNIAVLGNVCVYTVNENGAFCDNRPSPEDLVAPWEE